MSCVESGSWIFCTDQMPASDHEDPWGNIFVVFEEDPNLEPELVNRSELMAMIEVHERNGLPPKMHFHWTPTGLTRPPKRRNVN